MRKSVFTKSRFKIALNCVTQLYFTGKKEEYADNNMEDEFLIALAKGGYQVGELAKYYYCDDPVKERITIETLNYDEALKETENRLSSSERIVISEAAFLYKNLFVRVDLLVREGNVLNIYEVKAKSIDRDENFMNVKGTAILSKWSEYLYDVAFQRFVLANALKEKGFKIKSHLLLVNKDCQTDIDGLHQYFKVYSDKGKINVITKEGLIRKDLGQQILIAIPTDEICDRIETEFPVPTDLDENISFEDFIWRVASICTNDERVFTPLGSKCKNCSFYSDVLNNTPGIKSGFDECWKAATGLQQIERSLVTELWNGLAGNRSFATELVRMNKHFIHAVEESDIIPSGKSKSFSSGLTPHLRRMEQINRDKSGIIKSYFDSEGMQSEIESWTFPLHMIDFETSAVAIPFFKGMRPYEGIAFQFSHHTIDENWKIKHATQFLSFDLGRFPNFDFVRNLKNALCHDKGSVFRYHNHENTYLNIIYRQLENHKEPPEDKWELMNFIAEITHDRSRGTEGPRDMIDLYKLVIQFYYSPMAKGNNSLKQILPAIIYESEFLQSKYGKAGVYGKEKEIQSLNFEDHVWIRPEALYNPYKTLPRVFEEYDSETLDLLVKDMEELADGGTAMTAYNYLQFSEIPVDQRKRIAEALLKYCELDTLAMGMLVEGWKSKLDII